LRDSFDAFDYFDHLRSHWRIIGFALTAAIGLAFVISLLLPKRYTASTSILIDPPGFNDVRTATAVSPVYLESLRSFERFAASDKLFADAVQKFHLQDDAGRPSIESLKARVLRVSKPRDTKVLEISVTLPDAKMAHDVVSFITEKTIALNRSENVAADAELVDQSRGQLASAQARLLEARKAAVEDARMDSPEALSSTIYASLDVEARVRKDLVDAESDVAEMEEAARSSDAGGAEQAGYSHRQLPGAKARARMLRARLDEISRTLGQQKAALSKRTAQRAEIDADLKNAQANFDAASTRVRELESSAGNRGERLRIIDPGIIPQRPSSPNVVLNVVVAGLLAAVLSLLYVTFGFVQARRAGPKLRASVRGGLSA
jgi:uncharacterized protein involved in exopolysaccharide biosynthesis